MSPGVMQFWERQREKDVAAIQQQIDALGYDLRMDETRPEPNGPYVLVYRARNRECGVSGSPEFLLQCAQRCAAGEAVCHCGWCEKRDDGHWWCEFRHDDYRVDFCPWCGMELEKVAALVDGQSDADGE
jgi:hypothetical protein